jgi:hypothetical protein
MFEKIQQVLNGTPTLDEVWSLVSELCSDEGEGRFARLTRSEGQDGYGPHTCELSYGQDTIVTHGNTPVEAVSQALHVVLNS